MEFDNVSQAPKGEPVQLGHYPCLKEFDYEYFENTNKGEYALVRKPSIAFKSSYVEVHSSDDEDTSEPVQIPLVR